MRVIGTGAPAMLLVGAVLGACAKDAKEMPADRIKDFALPDLDGRERRLSELAKGKVLVLKFGATWCGWCNKQIPELDKVADAFPSGKVAIVEVDVREERDRVAEHVKKHGIRHPVLLDAAGKVADDYGVEGIPVVIVADPEGKVLLRANYVPFQKLEPVLEKAVSFLPQAAGR